MNTQTLSLIIAFVATIILGMIVVPKLRKLKIGQMVRDDGPQSHLKKSGTPTMGGIIMILVIVAILGINAIKNPILILPIVLVLGYGIVGFVDDYKKLVLKNTDGLSPKLKMLGLFLVSAIFIVLYLFVFNLGTDIIIPIFAQPFALSTLVFVFFTMFVLLGTTNAINFTDGLDGLASGVVAIIMTFFTIIAVKNGDNEMIMLGSVTVGTCIGFLMFNFHPARVFMGDTGSLALGGAVAGIAIILKMPLYLVIVALIPIIEVLSVVIQVTYFKLTNGKRFFKMAPFHHHLELSGLKETKVVFLFWIITALLCFICLFI
jgi:phospho-N-acetylmuramoyl-pentapeptide-transferase